MICRKIELGGLTSFKIGTLRVTSTCETLAMVIEKITVITYKHTYIFTLYIPDLLLFLTKVNFRITLDQVTLAIHPACGTHTIVFICSNCPCYNCV